MDDVASAPGKMRESTWPIPLPGTTARTATQIAGPARDQGRPGDRDGSTGVLAGRAVDGRDDRLQGGAGGVGVDADAPQHLAVDGALDVGGGLRGRALAHRVLLVVQQPYVDADAVQRGEERRDRTVAG